MRDANGVRRLLVAAAVLVPLAGLAARLYTGGWLIVLLGVIYLAVAGYHAVLHFKIARRVESPGVPMLIKIIASHAALFVAFLLQWDVGDGPSWLTISALLAGGPGYLSAEWLRISPGVGVIYDLALFVPVILSYVIIKRRPLGSAASRQRGNHP